MLFFPEDYFKAEVRDGFTINELMKRSWAAQLEVLSKIIAICDKYHLTYYAYWGTLLGAVRHHGFIPWDDDLDIAMKKDDYIKFLEVVKMELPQDYCILNYYTDTEHDDVFTRITNGHVIDLSESRLMEYHGCPFAVGIDVFPLYYLPKNMNEAEEQKMILNAISKMITLVKNADLQNEVVNNTLIAKGLVELERSTGYQFTTDRPILNHLRILYDQVCRLFEEWESDAFTVFPLYMSNGYMVEKEFMEESIQLPFENIILNAPKGYDQILTKVYSDYMVPRKVRATHDYPFYKGQLAILGNHIEKCGFNWKKQQRCISGILSENRMDEKTGMDLPKDWMEKIYPNVEDSRRKKIMMYHTSAGSLMCNGAFVLRKLRYVFEIFSQNSNVVLWWFPGFLDNPDLPYIQQMTPDLLPVYCQLIEEFQRENWGIYDDTGDMQRAVAMADAYYGDESDLLDLFKETGKAVMIQDYEITD